MPKSQPIGDRIRPLHHLHTISCESARTRTIIGNLPSRFTIRQTKSVWGQTSAIRNRCRRTVMSPPPDSKTPVPRYRRQAGNLAEAPQARIQTMRANHSREIREMQQKHKEKGETINVKSVRFAEKSAVRRPWCTALLINVSSI